MQSDTYAKLEREASALAMETVNLRNKTPIFLDKITNEFDPKKEFIISYDEDADEGEEYYIEYVNYPEKEDKRFPYVDFFSESSNLEEAIKVLDEKISKWKSYFDKDAISNEDLLKSENGTLVYFRYDKTIIGFKYGDHIVYPKFNFRTLELSYNFSNFDESFSFTPILGYEDDSSDFNYCVIPSVRHMVEEWKSLQKNKDSISACGSKIMKSWETCEWDNAPKLNPGRVEEIIEKFQTLIELVKN